MTKKETFYFQLTLKTYCFNDKEQLILKLQSLHMCWRGGNITIAKYKSGGSFLQASRTFARFSPQQIERDPDISY